MSSPAPPPLDYAPPGKPRRAAYLLAGPLALLVSLLALPASAFMAYSAANAAYESSETWTPAAAWSPPSAPLTPHQVAFLTTHLTTRFTDNLTPPTPAQSAAISAYLSSPTQSLFYPEPDDAHLRAQVNSISSAPNSGPLTAYTLRGRVTFAPDGTSSVVPSPQAFTGPNRHTELHPAALTAAACEFIAVLLALVLLTTAILTLRHSPRAPPLLRRYLLFKIPTALLATIAWPIAVQHNWWGPYGQAAAATPNALGLLYALLLALTSPRPTDNLLKPAPSSPATPQPT